MSFPLLPVYVALSRIPMYIFLSCFIKKVTKCMTRKPFQFLLFLFFVQTEKADCTHCLLILPYVSLYKYYVS